MIFRQAWRCGLLGLLMVSARPAFAANSVWDWQVTNGNWATAGNWNNGVPNGGSASIVTPATVSVTNAQSYSSLVMSSQESKLINSSLLQGIESIVSATVQNSGTWNSSSRVVILRGLQNSGLVTSATVVLGAATVTNTGTISGGSFTLGNTNFSMSAGLVDSGTMVVGDSGTTLVEISGGLFRSGGSNMTVGKTTTNTTLSVKDGGTVAVMEGSGTVTLGSGTNAWGTLNIGAGGLAGTLQAAAVTSGGGSGVVNFNHTGGLGFGIEVLGSVGVTKSGSGVTILTGSNSFSGGTVVNGGTLAVANNNAVGTGGVAVNAGTLLIQSGYSATNRVTLAGGTLEKEVEAGASLADAIKATSSLAGGPADTTVNILSGTTSAAAAVKASFSAPTGPNDGALRSDVLHLSGIPVVSGTTTDLFVLELSMPGVAEGSYLGWLNGNNLWVNAALGNTGNNAAEAQQGYAGSFAAFQLEFLGPLSSYVGAWGFTNTSVWAVLNHNSDFGVVPEPGTVGLVLLGAGALVSRRRRLTR